MNTGKKIKLIRTFRGLTQKELGEACGIHEVAIRKYELGKNIPKPEQLRKIAEALNVNVNSLVEFDIQADGDVLPLLFAIDEAFNVSIKEVDGEPGIFFDEFSESCVETTFSNVGAANSTKEISAGSSVAAGSCIWSYDSLRNLRSQ